MTYDMATETTTKISSLVEQNQRDVEHAQKLCAIDTKAADDKLTALQEVKASELKLTEDVLNKESARVKQLEDSINNPLHDPALWLAGGITAGVLVGFGLAYGGAYAWSLVK